MLQERPGDEKLEASLRNFDAALPHPDAADLKNAEGFAGDMLKAAR